MKKTLFYALALFALASCAKEKSSKQEVPFEKGQIVSLKVGASSVSKVSSSLNGDIVSFTWDEGDKIKVTVNGQSAEFTLKSGAGENEATFEGKMPASGTTFDVQYPVTTPEIDVQTYLTDEALAKNKMLFTDTDCTLADGAFQLKPQYSALRLQLWGEDKALSKLVITVDSNTYTLNISPAVALPSDPKDAKSFITVVPAGTYKFTADLYDATETFFCELEPSQAQEFKLGYVLKMPVIEAAPYTGGDPATAQ